MKAIYVNKQPLKSAIKSVKSSIRRLDDKAKQKSPQSSKS